VETWFLVSAAGKAVGGVACKRGYLYPRRAMRSVEWSGTVVPCSIGGQCARWCGVETLFFASAVDNALGGLAWKRGTFNPRRAMRSVECRGNPFPCNRGGQYDRCSGVETWFLVSPEGNAFGGVAWKSVSFIRGRHSFGGVLW